VQAPVLLAERMQLGIPKERVAVARCAAERTAVRPRRGEMSAGEPLPEMNS